VIVRACLQNAPLQKPGVYLCFDQANVSLTLLRGFGGVWRGFLVARGYQRRLRGAVPAQHAALGPSHRALLPGRWEGCRPSQAAASPCLGAGSGAFHRAGLLGLLAEADRENTCLTLSELQGCPEMRWGGLSQGARSVSPRNYPSRHKHRKDVFFSL